MATVHSLRRLQTLPISREECWRYFSDPRNLANITPPELRFRALDEDFRQMYPGMILRHRVSPILGVSMNWLTEITHVVEPELFVDEQRFGPYRFWHHQHHFREIDGGTRMEDIVHYSIPYGPFGELANVLFVRKQLDHIFDYRARTLARIFGSVEATVDG